MIISQPDNKTYGVLVISHGSRSSEWIQLVDEAVQAMSLPDETAVYSSFLEMVEGRTLQDGIDSLEAAGVTDIIAIPLFISSGSSHIAEIRYRLGVETEDPSREAKDSKQDEPDAEERLTIRAAVHFGEPIGDSEDIAQLLLEKLQGMSVQPDQEIVLVIGHGSDLAPGYRQWKQDLNGLAERIRLTGGFAEAEGVTLLPDELAERLSYWSREKPGCRVILAPLFVSPGYFTEKVIPKRAGEYDYAYNGKALLPSPVLTRWMERQAAFFLTGTGTDNLIKR